MARLYRLVDGICDGPGLPRRLRTAALELEALGIGLLAHRERGEHLVEVTMAQKDHHLPPGTLRPASGVRDLQDAVADLLVEHELRILRDSREHLAELEIAGGGRAHDAPLAQQIDEVLEQ